MRLTRTFEQASRWRQWFAWRPVKVSDGSLRWLEWLWRRQPHQGNRFISEYAPLGDVDVHYQIKQERSGGVCD